MVRQIFSSGFCFVVPTEDERELVRGYADDELLKLCVDRIPAVGDIRYYDKFDRYGRRLETHHFIIETVVGLDVIKVERSLTGDQHGCSEKTEVMVRIIYQAEEYREKNPPLWEPINQAIS